MEASHRTQWIDRCTAYFKRGKTRTFCRVMLSLWVDGKPLFPTLETIARLGDMCVWTAYRIAKKLAAAGFLGKQLRHDRDDEQTSTVYRIILPGVTHHDDFAQFDEADASPAPNCPSNRTGDSFSKDSPAVSAPESPSVSPSLLMDSSWYRQLDAIVDAAEQRIRLAYNTMKRGRYHARRAVLHTGHGSPRPGAG
jgi:hypothetical protein